MAENNSATQSEDIQNIMVEIARTQLAAVTAGLKFWGGWVESANKYAEKISAELENISEGETASDKFVGRFTDMSREYLREIIALPNLAVEHFATEVEKITKPAAKRTRKARAKD